MTVNYEQPDVWLQRAQILRKVFTPASPVNDKELFAGRTEQMLRIIDTFDSPGEHASIFGERGVGKTSLATISEQIAYFGGRLAVRINCRAEDAISDIWRRVGEAMDRRFRVDQTHEDSRLHRLDGVVQGAVAILTAPNVSTNDALVAFEMLSDAGDVVIFLDEFDRIEDDEVAVDLVDTLKTISDHHLRTTLVVVGVADTVDHLIQEHESIGRGLNEIEMPRMSPDELEDVLRRGLAQADMTASVDALHFIAQISTGLPHYGHLMGLNAGLRAVERQSVEVGVDEVLAALPTCVARAQQHVSRLYYAATHSTRPNKFREVLLAAALTKTDERGYFAPGDLRLPAAEIYGRPTGIPAFSDQLTAFATDERGPVLTRTGVVNRPRYRMTEPLLVPYVAMRGVTEDLITAATLRRLLTSRDR